MEEKYSYIVLKNISPLTFDAKIELYSKVKVILFFLDHPVC